MYYPRFSRTHFIFHQVQGIRGLEGNQIFVIYNRIFYFYVIVINPRLNSINIQHSFTEFHYIGIQKNYFSC